MNRLLWVMMLVGLGVSLTNEVQAQTPGALEIVVSRNTIPGSGDIDQNGVVDFNDASLALRSVGGTAPGTLVYLPTPRGFQQGDVNLNGRLDYGDVSLIGNVANERERLRSQIMILENEINNVQLNVNNLQHHITILTAEIANLQARIATLPDGLERNLLMAQLNNLMNQRANLMAELNFFTNVLSGLRNNLLNLQRALDQLAGRLPTRRFKPGDADGNGAVTSADATLVGQYLSGSLLSASVMIYNADANQDYFIDRRDIDRIACLVSATCR